MSAATCGSGPGTESCAPPPWARCAVAPGPTSGVRHSVSGYRYAVPVDLRAPTIGFRCRVRGQAAHAPRCLRPSRRRKSRLPEDKRAELMTTKSGDRGRCKQFAEGHGGQRRRHHPARPCHAEGRHRRRALQESSGHGILARGGSNQRAGGQDRGYPRRGQCLAASCWQPPAEPTRFTSTPNHPAMSIWDDATAFCEWLTEQDRRNKLLPPGARYRLPTDAEWSTAAGLGSEAGGDPARAAPGQPTMLSWGTEWPPKPLSVNLDAPNVQGFRTATATPRPWVDGGGRSKPA